jgi:hypothetical protein
LSVNGEHSLNDANSSIDAVIAYVKEEFKNILAKRKDPIIKLGEVFERKVSDRESVCEEIKNALREEIAQGLVSTRIIELHCQDKWKRKTKLKKVEKNENFSFSRQEQHVNPPIMIDTHGNSVTEPAAISDPDLINDVVSKRSAKEEIPCKEESTVRDEESVIRRSTSVINTDQQISEQYKVKELEAEIGILRLDLESKSKENSALQTQVKGLELKLKSALDNGFNQNSEDRFFKVQFQVPSEDLRRHMDSSRGKIDSVPITPKVDLATKSIAGIEIGESDSQESTRTGEENSSFC